ncbi:MAG: LptF/LptG family permease [Chlamydiota bacterium]
MAILKIWQKHLLKDFFRIFFLFIGSFYFLYVLIDYSAHTKHFSQADFSFPTVALYYLCHFTKRAEILIPFATMLAVIKVLTTLNLNRELVGYQAGGFSLTALLRPFLIIAVALSAMILLNFEYLAPKALNMIQWVEDTHFDGQDNHQQPSVYHLNLDDNNTLLYQHYDSVSQGFFDVFFIKSLDDIYHIKYLLPHGEVPVGHYVDHFISNEEGTLVKSDSQTYQEFEEIIFEEKELQSIITPYHFQPPSQLWKQASYKDTARSERNNRIIATLYAKLATALACLLAVIGPAPFCVRFTRNMPTFFIYSLSIFGLVSFFTILDAGYILGENGILPPFLALWGPAALFVGWASRNYYKMASN